MDAACTRFEEKKVNWKKRLTDGRMKNIAFVLDPDGYWIEASDACAFASRNTNNHQVLQNEKSKPRSNW